MSVVGTVVNSDGPLLPKAGADPCAALGVMEPEAARVIGLLFRRALPQASAGVGANLPVGLKLGLPMDLVLFSFSIEAASDFIGATAAFDLPRSTNRALTIDFMRFEQRGASASFCRRPLLAQLPSNGGFCRTVPSLRNSSIIS